MESGTEITSKQANPTQPRRRHRIRQKEDTMNEIKNYNFKAIRVKQQVHERFTKQRKAAGLSATQYAQYLLNLGRAYPPTIDYRRADHEHK